MTKPAPLGDKPKYFLTQGQALAAAQELIGTTRLKLFIVRFPSTHKDVYTVQYADGSYAITQE